ncbi:hypothetical protein OBV_27500 [Oscillibacter valericigenes Sjm18-20]|nr:hypothetical protein OBV_27500 [Oscillibacter valericigenes Sjm18-20]
MVTKKELESKLDEALKSYVKDTTCIASDPYGKRQITEGELVELSKQTLYALLSFKKAILEYLP